MGSVPVPVSITILVLIAATALLAMWWGWQKRKQRSDELIPALPTIPRAGELGTARTEVIPAVYVSSTRSGDWLERVNAHGLGVRSRATVQVTDAGVMIERTGANDLFIPASSIRGTALAPGMAGKVVGRDGLVVITWTAPEGLALDTGLLPAHRTDRDVLRTAITALTQGTGTQGNGLTEVSLPTSGGEELDQERNETGSSEPEERK